MLDEDLSDDDVAHLVEVTAMLRGRRLELTRTVRAIRAGRLTPQQIRAVIDRAKRTVNRSVLLRRAIERRWRVQ